MDAAELATFTAVYCSFTDEGNVKIGHLLQSALYRLYLGIADGISTGRAGTQDDRLAGHLRRSF